MTSTTQELVYVAAAGIVTATLALMFDFFPLLFVLPALLAYTIASPVAYLVALAAVAELFSLQPFGIVTLVIFLPWLISRLFSKFQADLSVAFFLIVGAIMVAQFLVLFSPNVFIAWQGAAWAPMLLPEALTAVPWTWLPFLLLPAVILCGASILIHFNRRW